MFISPAYAQAAGAETSLLGGGLLPLVLIFVIFYFLIIRPQNKRMKQHKAMVAAVKRGDSVVTAGGIIGKVTRVHDDEVQVEIADEVRVKVVKSTLSDVRAKGEPVREQKRDRISEKDQKRISNKELSEEKKVALKVLGLSEGARPNEIRKAHKRLIRETHPDSGGTTADASELNEARDTLLN